MRKLRPQAREPHRPHVRRLALPKISTHLRLGWRGFYTNARHTHPLQPPRLRRVGQLGAMRCPGPLKDEWISPLTTAPTPHTHTHTHLLPECLLYLRRKWLPALHSSSFAVQSCPDPSFKIQQRLPIFDLVPGSQACLRL